MEEKLPFEKIKRGILIKREAKTDKNYGKNPEDRTAEELLDYGVICINKPAGPTSHQISDYVKKMLNIESCGHGGTLDPAVTGVLPVALNKATRIVQTLLLGGKEYVALMHLHKEADIKDIEKKFTGKIKQIPPLKSAVKRVEREREIYYLKILEVEGKDVLFKVGCQAGTYIRKLCVDIGKSLGIGAHMAQLIRTKAGPFTDKEMYSLHDLKDAYEFYKEGESKELKKIIKPMEFAIQTLPKVYVLDTTVDSLCHGATLSIPGISKLESEIKNKDLVAVLTLKGELICLGEAILSSEEIVKNDRGSAIKTKKVFMSPNTYPKFINQSLQNKSL